MENSNLGHSDHDKWTTERMAALEPEAGWKPQTDRALGQLRGRQAARPARTRRLAIAGAVVVASSVSLAAYEPSRAFAQECVAFCSAEAQHWFSRDGLMEFHMWVATMFGINPGAMHAKYEPGSLKMAPDFALVDAAGRSVKLSDFRGKVVLLNFWATWCPPCREEIPWFVEFQKKYGDQGFVVLGVSLDEDGWKSVKPFMEAKQVNYPVVIGDDAVANLFDVKNLPQTFLIGRKGRILLDGKGLMHKEEYRNEIISSLK